MKKNKKFYIGILVGILITLPLSIYGATTLFSADEVSYDNSSSGGSSTNVKGSLDELYTLSKSLYKLPTTTTFSASDLLSGKTAYNNKGELITGTIANNGSWGSTISPGESVIIPAGYHNGSGKVSAKTVSSTNYTTSSTFYYSSSSINLSVKQNDLVIFNSAGTVSSVSGVSYKQIGYKGYLHGNCYMFVALSTGTMNIRHSSDFSSGMVVTPSYVY